MCAELYYVSLTLDKMDRRSPSQIFIDYQVELQKILPMNNEVFIALLVNNNFLNKNQRRSIFAMQSVLADSKVSYFLEFIIGRDVNNFETLLNVMEVFGGSVAILALEIKEKIGLKSYQGALCWNSFFVCQYSMLCAFVWFE